MAMMPQHEHRLQTHPGKWVVKEIMPHSFKGEARDPITPNKAGVNWATVCHANDWDTVRQHGDPR